jgi:hypothetical protein
MGSAPLLRRRSIQKRANALRRPTIFTDDLTDVVARNAQLHDDAPIVLKFVHFDRIWIVDQRLSDRGNEIFQCHVISPMLELSQRS